MPGRRAAWVGPWDARRRVWERAPGDAGVRLASPERVHSSDDCAAAGFAAAFAAQPAESRATNGTRAKQFRKLLADTSGGGRVATVHCTGTQVALWRGQAMRWAPQIITTARRARAALQWRPPPDGGARRRAESKAIAVELGASRTCCTRPDLAPGQCPALKRPSWITPCDPSPQDGKMNTEATQPTSPRTNK